MVGPINEVKKTLILFSSKRLAKAKPLIIVISLFSTTAIASDDKYHVTPEEHQACDADAASLCYNTLSEEQLLACMKSKREQLSSICLEAFLAGMKKRHLPI